MLGNTILGSWNVYLKYKILVFVFTYILYSERNLCFYCLYSDLYIYILYVKVWWLLIFRIVIILQSEMLKKVSANELNLVDTWEIKSKKVEELALLFMVSADYLLLFIKFAQTNVLDLSSLINHWIYELRFWMETVCHSIFLLLLYIYNILHIALPSNKQFKILSGVMNFYWLWIDAFFCSFYHWGFVSSFW